MKMLNRFSKLRKGHHGQTNDLAGHSQDLPSLEKATHNKKSRAIFLINSMQQFFYFLAICLIIPLLIFGGLKFLIARIGQDSNELNVDIGSAVGTVIAMHILLIIYIIRLVLQQNDKLEVWGEWDTNAYQMVSENDEKRGPLVIVLLLLFYCSLIVILPIFVFFALKFIVLKNLFLITNMDRDIISVIGAVIAVHAAVGFYIYRVYYYGGSGKSMIKNN